MTRPRFGLAAVILNVLAVLLGFAVYGLADAIRGIGR